MLFFVAISKYRYPATETDWLYVATALCGGAAATDFLDGWLARRWQVVTAFGRVMDPFCDKLLVLGALICLAGPRFVVPAWEMDGHLITTASGLTPWMVGIVIARELFVTSVRGMAESAGLAFGAKWSGKAKMALQSVSIPIVLVLIAAAPPGDHAATAWIIVGLMWTMIGVTIWSGLPYVAAVPSLMRTTTRP